MIHLGDISKIDGTKIPPVTVITFGSPCQNLSIAGNREGLAGEQSGLFMEAVRVIKEMRSVEHFTKSNEPIRYPKFAIWENVPGAFSSNMGNDFTTVLEELASISGGAVTIPKPEKGWKHSGAVIGDGYSIAWRLFDAQYLGVPQRRKRITLIMDIDGERAGEILFERTSLSGDIDEGIEAWKGVARNPAESVGIRDCKTLQIRSGCDGGGKGALIQDNLSATLSTVQSQTLF